MIIRLEDVQESPNTEISDIMDDVVKTFKDNDIEIDYVNPDNKTIYVLTDESLDDANYILRADYPDARRLGVRVAKNFKQTKTIDVIDPIKSEINESLNEVYAAGFPVVNTIPKDVDNVYEYVIRDLIGMEELSDFGTDKWYVGTNNNGQFIVATIYRETDAHPDFYIFNNLTQDEIDDIVTILKDGDEFLWDGVLNDYNLYDTSFWEYIQECQ